MLLLVIALIPYNMELSLHITLYLLAGSINRNTPPFSTSVCRACANKKFLSPNQSNSTDPSNYIFRCWRRQLPPPDWSDLELQKTTAPILTSLRDCEESLLLETPFAGPSVRDHFCSCKWQVHWWRGVCSHKHSRTNAFDRSHSLIRGRDKTWSGAPGPDRWRTEDAS